MDNLSGKDSKITQVWMPGRPTSVDPLDCDSFVHHIAFRSVLGTLVTTYRLGGFTGVIADGWQVSEDQTQWQFSISKEAKFETGAPITPLDVIRSWKRVAFLLKKKKSHSDFLDSIVGMDSLSAIDSPVSGLEVSGTKILVRLRHPYKKILETLSFGLYSVVSPSDFNPVSGQWVDLKKAVSSNAYKIRNWSDQEINLELRNDRVEPRWHSRPIQKLRLVWDESKQLESQLVIGDSNDASLSKKFTFFGAMPSGIAFGRCFSWKKQGSVCNSPENRRSIRDLIYEALSAGGIRPVKSFFPLGMQGVHEVADTDTSSAIKSLKGISQLRVFYRRKIGNGIFEAIRSNISTTANARRIQMNEIDFSYDVLQQQLSPELDQFAADVGIMLSDIEVKDPNADIRFMFLSKEGIRLPDVTGDIHRELEKPDFSAQRINQLLWDQAVIFPLGHFSFGVWASDRYDLSLLNTVEPPIEFQWIGWKSAQ